MTLQPDDITRKKLVLVKLLFLQADEQAHKSYSPINRIIAVIAFDHASETLLKILLFQLTGDPGDQKPFHNLIADIDQKFTSQGVPKLEKTGGVKRVHTIRSDAQHKARYPTEDEVQECRVYTRDFLDAAYSRWGMSWEAMDLTMLIDDPDLRALCELSQEALKEGNCGRSVISARIVFEWALESIITAFPRHSSVSWVVPDIEAVHGPLNSGLNDRNLSYLRNAVANAVKYLDEDIEAVRTQALVWSSGVSVVSYQAFRKVCRFGLMFTSNQTPRIQTVGDFEPDIEQATRAYNFVVDTLIQWQAQGLEPRVPQDAHEAAQKLIQTKASGYSNIQQ